jgi:hypothetical protein
MPERRPLRSDIAPNKHIYLFFEQVPAVAVPTLSLYHQQQTMIDSQEDPIAFLANDLFNKRQRLIRASQPIEVFDDRSISALETEYQVAESEYLEAKATFARAITGGRSAPPL